MKKPIRYDQLSDERKALIDENLLLIDKAIVTKRHYLNFFEYEDLWSAGYIAMVRAAKGFDINRDIRFSTYAVTSIQNEFYTMYSKVLRRNKIANISLVEEDELSFLMNEAAHQTGKMPDTYEKSDELYTKTLIDILLDILPEEDKKYPVEKIIRYYSLGYKKTEICRMLHLRPANIDNLLKSIREKSSTDNKLMSFFAA